LPSIFEAVNFALVTAKKEVTSKEKRISKTFSGVRLSTINWFQERADEADLPFSKYISLLLDAIKNDAEKNLEGGGGNRTRQLLATWFHDSRGRAMTQGKAA
jgi:hypothetical protein